ncbi:winged helix-turn-helix domain-containing protein [Aquipuribacter nitratireducens]|uniref:Winged helix-turn-helix domain-containing protein n=1 Tax=Aquipuribacter nitratireducens TaxID=650104 RepID=A0ABW0GKD7_9MICO
MPRELLRADQARRLALGAQGLLAARPRPGAASDRGHVRRLVERLGAVQVDSVNVVARAHLLPFLARLGDYRPDVLDAALRASSSRPPVAWEYWGHEASYVPAGALAALRFRMREAEERAWGGMLDVARRRPQLLTDVVAALADGPLTARQLQALLEPAHRRRSDHWGWNWSDVKRAVEMAFWSGQVTSAGRTTQFERRYDLPERVWPAEALRTPWPDRVEAALELVRRAGLALGVATLDDLADHYRLRTADARGAVAALVESGDLVPVEVVGWDAPAWRHTAVPLPRASAVEGPGVLLAPFDPLVWHRPRTERLFGFRYRLEIYVPAARRVHGYYVLPFLHRGRLVARVDLKADRRAGRLLVRAAWAEAGTDGDDVAALAAECGRVGRWLGCPDVVVEPLGDLAAPLALACRAVTGR